MGGSGVGEGGGPWLGEGQGTLKKEKRVRANEEQPNPTHNPTLPHQSVVEYPSAAPPPPPSLCEHAPDVLVCVCVCLVTVGLGAPWDPGCGGPSHPACKPNSCWQPADHNRLSTGNSSHRPIPSTPPPRQASRTNASPSTSALKCAGELEFGRGSGDWNPVCDESPAQGADSAEGNAPRSR